MFVTPHGGEWIRPILTPSDTWFIRPTWVIPSNGISIGLAAFAHLTRVPNTQTHHTNHTTCDICSNGPHLMHCLMRPKLTLCVRYRWLIYCAYASWTDCYHAINNVNRHIARTAKRRLFKLLRGRFWGFRSAGATHCIGGGEIWQGGAVPSSMANFTPIGATMRV